MIYFMQKNSKVQPLWFYPPDYRAFPPDLISLNGLNLRLTNFFKIRTPPNINSTDLGQVGLYKSPKIKNHSQNYEKSLELFLSNHIVSIHYKIHKL